MASAGWGVWHRDLIAGRIGGLRAALWRALLTAIEKPYAWAVRRRNTRYDRGWASCFSAAAPVISVGNLTLGGVGKTPMVALLAQWCQSQGLRPVIISRGYRSRGGLNDEAIELDRRLPGIVHLQQADRVAAARDAVALHGADVLLLDDGFQHRRLRRDLDIVLLDGLDPFGRDRLFPRGTLREPVESLARAQVIVLTRADAVSPDARAHIHRRAMAASPSALWLEGVHAPQALVGAAGELSDPGEASGRRAMVFCGIGNPDGFRHTVESLGCVVAGLKVFDDHHAYSAAEVRRLAEQGAEAGADWLLCTEKDLVKIDPRWWPPGPRPAAVRISMELVGPLDAWHRRLAAAVQSRSAQ